MNPDIRTTCCIAGGGPSGMMLGYLLARCGVQVTVLEKHADFFRDFRGDTVHPSTLALMDQLGLLEELLQIPHHRVTSVHGVFGGSPVHIASFTGLNTRCPYVAFMPQWDFLNFLSSKAKQFAEFDLRMGHEVIDLLQGDDRVRGVLVRTPEGIRQVEADLVVGCDGRHSITRERAGLPVHETGVPIDVLWFRVSRRESDPAQSVVGNVDFAKVLILLDRQDYFQAGLIIRKDSFPDIQHEGLEQFRWTIGHIAPLLKDRVDEIQQWSQINLLTVRINRLRRWHRPGLLCIGDAAHAMSPAFGVGINLAIQDAVAAANILAPALQRGYVPDTLLAAVERRREFPTRVTQFLQVIAHKGLEHVFRQHGPMRPPLLLRLVTKIPGFQRAMGRVVGIGVRPELVHERILKRRVSPARRMAAVGAGIVAGVRAWKRSYAA